MEAFFATSVDRTSNWKLFPLMRVYYHSGGRAITAWVIGGWIGSDWVSSRSRLERHIRATFGKDFENDLWRPDRY
ncbi:hypothetical protein PVK06_026770 [Gossypium arboreum]|uniref:Uncharacterized protein n=1 Tax=Gossypium arboreum TaxID=29729 RepID=A0ABR0NZW1_GOSAR|nr:hypothetical protein PVK06_026770 [Gossypium arboreum]